MLDARLDMPEDADVKTFVIMSHCFTCSKETLTTSRVSRGLAQQGIAVLRFDFTGLGNSEGNFADTNFTSMVEDIICAAEFLRAEYHSPCGLLGHSMGGTSALVASQNIASCRTVITIASPSQPSHVLHHFGPAMARLEASQDAEINVAGMMYPVKPQFIHNVREFDMDSALQAYDKSLLVIRAGKDELVKPEDAEEILTYSDNETRLFQLDEADHLFRDRQHSDLLVTEINQWLDDHCVNHQDSD